MKKIAIVGYQTGPNSFGVGKNYLELIRVVGAEPVVIHPSNRRDYHRDVIEQCDLLILPGGPDLPSHHYGEAPSYFAGDTCRFREYFFKEHLGNYIGAVPVFGICLGFQMLNVFFGGKLVQDISNHSFESRGAIHHRVFNLNSGEADWVNSHHHQAVLPSILGQDLDVFHVSTLYPEKKDYQEKKLPTAKDMIRAYSEDSSSFVVESFFHKLHDVVGVQWHPEEIFDDFSLSMIRSMIS